MSTSNGVLETFPNQYPGREYEVNITCPELRRSVRKPEARFATIRITYVPDERIIELKSLKLYIHSFRDQGSSTSTSRTGSWTISWPLAGRFDARSRVISTCEEGSRPWFGPAFGRTLSEVSAKGLVRDGRSKQRCPVCCEMSCCVLLPVVPSFLFSRPSADTRDYRNGSSLVRPW